ncbi:MAG: hypothetical protein ACM3ML_17200 [Micromonosporaceae bacterium]
MPLVVAVAVLLIFGGFYYWARRQGLLTTGPAAEAKQGTRRISLLTEAVAYIGAILVLAGGIAAVGQQWHSITAWGHVGIFAGIAVFFLAVGIVVHGVREPAIGRLADVVWFLSVAGVAGAVGFAAQEVYGTPVAVTALAVGVGITVYSAVLWLLRRHALQNFALFTGLIVTICGVIVTIDDSPPSPAFAIALWAFGLAWVGLGGQRYVEPLWVSVPSGVILALIAPALAVGEHGWVYAIGITTAAAAMAASVPLRNTPLLALGALAMFGYLTGVVVSYFHESLGVPGALAITGVLILGLAAVTARLMRATHPPKPKQPGAAAPPPAAHPPAPEAPGPQKPSDRDLPKAS